MLKKETFNSVFIKLPAYICIIRISYNLYTLLFITENLGNCIYIKLKLMFLLYQNHGNLSIIKVSEHLTYLYENLHKLNVYITCLTLPICRSCYTLSFFRAYMYAYLAGYLLSNFLVWFSYIENINDDVRHFIHCRFLSLHSD